MMYSDETGIDIVFGTRDIGLSGYTLGNGNDKYCSVGFHQLSQGYAEDTKIEDIRNKEKKGFAERPVVEMVFPANDPKGLDTVLKMFNDMRKENYPYYAVVFDDEAMYENSTLQAGFTVVTTLKEAQKNLAKVEEAYGDETEFRIVKLYLHPNDVEDLCGDGWKFYTKKDERYEELTKS